MKAPLPPLKLTTARWFNHEARSSGRDRSTGYPIKRWSKVLAHTGSYEQFRYGSDTPSEWRSYSGKRIYRQRAIVCSVWTGVIGIDVDDEAEYMTTELARHIRREQAISTRGSGWHALIDARTVPASLWPPKQCEIRGANGLHAADVKSRGFLPVPGSWHYSEEQYEPVLHPGGMLHIVQATPEIMAAIAAGQQAPSSDGNGHGSGGGNGGGHDGEVAATVLSNILRGLTKEQCYQEWLKIAIPHDPDDPFTAADFERHYGDENRGALARARQIQRADAALIARTREWLGGVL
jgi:hypothetical protein